MMEDRTFEEALANALQVTNIINGEPKSLLTELWKHFYNRKDCIGLLPTGYGKSLIFQISPFLYAAKKQVVQNISEVKNITLVISPLNSIMKNQAHSLCQMGVPSCYVDMCLRSGKTNILKSDAFSVCEEDEDSDEDNEMLEVTAPLQTITAGAYP